MKRITSYGKGGSSTKKGGSVAGSRTGNWGEGGAAGDALDEPEGIAVLRSEWTREEESGICKRACKW